MVLVVALGAAVASAVAAPAAADCPTRADEMALLSADVNGDGQPDFLVRATPYFVPLDLDDDMPVVIPVPRPIEGFVLTSDGGSYGLTSLDPYAAVASTWVPSASSLFVEDVKGSGCASVILQAVSGARTLSVGYDASQTPYLIQQLGSAPGEAGDLSGAALDFKDMNGDSRIDLEVSRSGAVQAIYLAQADGVLRLDPAASALAVWRSFLAAMAANDVEWSLRHLTATSAPAYESTMRGMGSDLSLLPARTVDFAVVDARDEAVRVTVIIQQITSSTLFFVHYVDIVNDKGTWAIESF